MLTLAIASSVSTLADRLPIVHGLKYGMDLLGMVVAGANKAPANDNAVALAKFEIVDRLRLRALPMRDARGLVAAIVASGHGADFDLTDVEFRTDADGTAWHISVAKFAPGTTYGAAREAVKHARNLSMAPAVALMALGMHRIELMKRRFVCLREEGLTDHDGESMTVALGSKNGICVANLTGDYATKKLGANQYVLLLERGR